MLLNFRELVLPINVVDRTSKILNLDKGFINLCKVMLSLNIENRSNKIADSVRLVFYFIVIVLPVTHVINRS